MQLSFSYDIFLKYWIDTYGDVGGPYFSEPTIKDLVAETGLTYSVIRKQITQAYLDLVEDVDEGVIYRFINIEYWFHIQGYDGLAYFIVKEIPVIPRVGEEITIPLFKAYLGNDSYYVEKIEHELINDKHTRRNHYRNSPGK